MQIATRNVCHVNHRKSKKMHYPFAMFATVAIENVKVSYKLKKSIHRKNYLITNQQFTMLRFNF